MNHNMKTNKTFGMRKTAQIASKKPISSFRRLKQDYMMILKDPIPYVSVAPLPNDILECHYVIHGPENSLYQGGIYHGKLKFPLEYPFKPPSIYMITPNGRFKTNTRLCLSFSDYHPDTWNPTWNLSTILTGLLSFMLEDHSAVGTIQTTDNVKRTFAKKSLEFNISDKLFVELFPDITQDIRNILSENGADDKSLKSRMNGISNKLCTESDSVAQQSNRFLLSCIYNLIGVIAVVIFVFIVKWVLNDENVISS